MSLNKPHTPPESEQRLHHHLSEQRLHHHLSGKRDKCNSIRLTLVTTMLTPVFATATSKNGDAIIITPPELQLLLCVIATTLISITAHKTVQLQRMFLVDMVDGTAKLVDVGLRLSVLTNFLTCGWLVGQTAQHFWPSLITEAGLGYLLLSAQIFAASLVAALIANFKLTPSVKEAV